MYSLHPCHTSLVCVLLFFVSVILGQDTSLQTIYSLDIFSSQKPCARSCFWQNYLGCQIDGVASKIGCGYNYCNQNTELVGAQNSCYCRIDLQPAAEAYITSCVKSACTVGDSSIDISSAGSIYNYYCSSKGFLVNVPATTTQGGSQATTTMGSLPPQTSSPNSDNESPTSTSPGSASTGGGNGGGSGLSSPELAGIGSIAGIISCIVAVWGCICYKNRNKA